MLAVKNYAQDYIDECRSAMDAQLAAYDALVSAATAGGALDAGPAIETFGPLFLNNLVLVLDGYFMHRTRAIEGKDGNPLNEVRMLCASILGNHGVLRADKTISYSPQTSVLGLAIGDDIRLDEAGFRRLVDAYFAELQKRFT